MLLPAFYCYLLSSCIRVMNIKSNLPCGRKISPCGKRVSWWWNWCWGMTQGINIVWLGEEPQRHRLLKNERLLHWGNFHYKFRIFRRKASFIHRTRDLTEGHWRAMPRRTVLLAANLGSCRILLPISPWKDSSFISKVVFRIHDSAPYSRVGSTQHSMILLEESGLRVPWKVPLPLEKKKLL